MAGYLGNTSDMVVHHLATMKKECKIYYIKKDNKVYFTPDTLEQAINQKFVVCLHCNTG
jgi:hypothetical protein